MDQHELWQVEVDGKIYETDLAGLTQWIAESSLLPDDKIKRGEMPWIQAKLVPALAPYFDGKAPAVSENTPTVSENFNPAEPLVQPNTISHAATENFGVTAPTTSTGFAAPYQTEPAEEKVDALPPGAPIGQFSATPSGPTGNGKCCALHPVREATFACRQCLNLFCAECPRTIAKVRICPLCGDMCNTISAPKVVKNTKDSRPFFNSDKFNMSPVNQEYTLSDFKTAWVYPFRFPLALIVGGVLSSLLGLGVYLGMVTASVGRLFPGLMTMLFCSVLCAAIVYGSATKAVNQVAYGKIDETFMPSTEDFSIWDTILSPCFLGLGTCLISWGPMVLVGLLIFKLIAGASADAAKELKSLDTSPQRQNVLLAPDQIAPPRDPLQRDIEGNSRDNEAAAIKRIQALQQTPTSPMGFAPPAQDDKKAQAEAMAAFVKKVGGRLIPLVLLLMLTALWGIFYFPTALTVAGYTESVGATMNPLVGFGMMRQMGGNYFKAFGTYLLLLIASIFIYAAVMIVTAPLAAMGFGQVPANFIANIISFYLYLVIACMFGLALYRSHEKMGFTVAN
jgi:hypothetical protein